MRISFFGMRKMLICLVSLQNSEPPQENTTRDFSTFQSESAMNESSPEQSTGTAHCPGRFVLLL